jgi:hypothetical protein
MHELRLSIKTLTERVDTVLKTTGEDIAPRSEKSEPTTDPKNFLDTGVVESESSLTSDALEATEPARLEVTSSALDIETRINRVNTAGLIERVATEHGMAKEHARRIIDSALAVLRQPRLAARKSRPTASAASR